MSFQQIHKHPTKETKKEKDSFSKDNSKNQNYNQSNDSKSYSMNFNFSDIRIFDREEDALDKVDQNHNVFPVLRGTINTRVSNIQLKLKINQKDDPFEREADRVAESVMKTSYDKRINRKCSSCEISEGKDEKNFSISRKPSTKSKFKTSNNIIHGYSNIFSNTSSRLDTDTKDFMESRLGYDFSEVRIHADQRDAESAEMLNALAFTVGRDIGFGSGQFSPSTLHGRRLLAHELTHIIQQDTGSVHGIQRQPAPGNDTQSTVLLPVQDPDTEEDAARAADPSLASIDRKLKSKQNEDAVNAIVLRAFGGEERLNATFETLSDEVKSQVDNDTEKDFKAANTAGKITDEAVQKPKMKTLNRIQFLVRMRLYFNSWSDVLNHFRAIRKLKFNAKMSKNKGRVNVFLHDSAAERLRRVLEVLESNGHELPNITVGFGLRQRYRGKFHTFGQMTHAMGYAMDIEARQNPHITTEGEGDLEKNDLYQIEAVVGKLHTYMNMDDQTKNLRIKGTHSQFIYSMGKGKAKDEDVKKYFEAFEKEFRKMEASSIQLSKTVFGNNRDQLLKIRSDYFDLLRLIESKHTELKKERAKGSKSNPKLITSIKEWIDVLEAQKVLILSTIPLLITQWITAIDAKIENVLKENSMDKMRSPSEISIELKSMEAEVKKANKKVKDAQSAVNKAEADLKKGKLDRFKALDAHALLGNTKEELGRFTSARDALALELKKSNVPKLSEKWIEIRRLRDYRKSLATPDLSKPATIRSFERLTTGNLKEDAPVRNPPLLRLLDKGFFNPKVGFNLDFFKEMTRNGFWPGATWSNPDSMHFELVEGRFSINTPGIIEKDKTRKR